MIPSNTSKGLVAIGKGLVATSKGNYGGVRHIKPTDKILDRFEIWSGQRTTDEAKIREIIQYIQSGGAYTRDFGEITVCEYRNNPNSKIIIIDGQHRYRAWTRLRLDPNFTGKLQDLRTYSHYVDSEQEIRYLFENINKNTLVPRLHLTAAELKQQLRENVIKYCEEYKIPYKVDTGKTSHPSGEPGSARCHRPRIDISKYIEQLYHQEYATHLQQYEDLKNLLNNLCIYIYDCIKTDDMWLTQQRKELDFSEKMVNELKDYNIDAKRYLGYFYSTKSADKSSRQLSKLIRDCILARGL